jgi:hypothetical protein
VWKCPILAFHSIEFQSCCLKAAYLRREDVTSAADVKVSGLKDLKKKCTNFEEIKK